MGVIVDHARNDGFPAKIDAPRVRAREARDVLIAPDRNDTIPLHRHRLRDREAVIDRDDLAVGEDGIGRGLLRMYARAREQRSGEARSGNPMFHGMLRSVSRSVGDELESVDAPAAILVDIDVALGIDGNAVRLV